jgi:hypothetical protein
MGMQKTPEAFRRACKRFIFLENLEGGPDTGSAAEKPAAKGNLNEARTLILKAMDAIDQDDEWYRLGQLGQHIVSANPDFDTRTYGKRKLSDLVTEMKVLEVKRGPNNQLMVRRRD